MRLNDITHIHQNRRKRNSRLKILFPLLIMTIIVLNTLFVSKNFNSLNLTEDEFQNKNENIVSIDSPAPKTSIDTSMLQDPYTKNFENLKEFFINNYQSDLDYDIPTYFRVGDGTGNIIDDTIFSEDNLLLYRTLMRAELNESEIFETYLQLKNTTLWYEDSNNQYGFVKSVDNSTGLIKDDNRYLIDNLEPIFLLIENIGDNIDNLLVDGENPTESIDEQFNLINSSQFWDKDDLGFYQYNSSTTYYSESNFYSVLANLLIHRTYRNLNIDSQIRDRSYELANLTMNSLNTGMWEPSDNAFFYNATSSWDTSGSGQAYYHLSTNALGIFTLVEYWIETGMKNDSSYLQQAIQLYNSLENRLWNDTNPYNLYMNTFRLGDPDVWDDNIDLKANSMMMSSVLKLFEVTGNITYYNKAITIFNELEKVLYDNQINAYNDSISNNNKILLSNLKLFDAYHKAYNIFNSTVLSAEYNLSNQIPDFIFNQDKMNITSIYSYRKTLDYFNPVSKLYIPFTIEYNITNWDINYLFKYSNGSLLTKIPDQILDPETTHNLLYNIVDTIPIDQGYYIYIWANTSYFRMSEITKRFSVTSGLTNISIEGTDDRFYQGPFVNVSLVINYTRTDNLTLTAHLEGENIVNSPVQEINFTASTEERISFNITANLGSIPGPSEIFFRIKKGNILYLEVKIIIEIGYSFDYSNLLYQGQVVSGDNVFISLNLINFLPNSSQSVNISFKGVNEGLIEDYNQEEVLIEGEIKTVSYHLQTLENIRSDTINIKMSISINTTEYYTEILIVEVIPQYEIKSVSFPRKIPQGTEGYLIIVIQNNHKNSEEFSLTINGKIVATNINELAYGENRIVKKIIPTINPYELGKKSYQIVLKDSSDQEIAQFYFEVQLELSILNLLLFYVLPILIPVGIILFFLNKDIKNKKLRR